MSLVGLPASDAPTANAQETKLKINNDTKPAEIPKSDPEEAKAQKAK